ncbi:helix-turn-helix domain-containing protein [Aquihabitans sp. McL0605]|uniref:helix-turn-helix domain-containing protein n=1 Tax=Aquihabitans sp. McL0605 TaxID=3415671 RepID=UPI003CF2D7A6
MPRRRWSWPTCTGGRVRTVRRRPRCVRRCSSSTRPVVPARPVSSGRRPRAPLRPRREVALLAAGGMASREIAERLYLSKRTIDSHLSSVYRKLGVTGRDQLHAALDPAMGEPR